MMCVILGATYLLLQNKKERIVCGSMKSNKTAKHGAFNHPVRELQLHGKSSGNTFG